MRNPASCRCGGDMPGHCPGPAACPMCAPTSPECEVCGSDDDAAAPVTGALSTLLQGLRPEPGRAGALKSRQVTQLLRDRAGWLWVSGYGLGLQRHNPNNRAISACHFALISVAATFPWAASRSSDSQ